MIFQREKVEDEDHPNASPSVAKYPNRTSGCMMEEDEEDEDQDDVDDDDDDEEEEEEGSCAI